MAVYEMLEMTQAIADAAVHDKATHFTDVARAHLKGKTLLDYALEKMKLGATTVSEVMSISNQVED
jgi:MSHA biogenesis protein MshE